MENNQLTDDQLIACWKQTRLLIVRNQRERDALESRRNTLDEQSEHLTIELVKRGYKVTLPILGKLGL